MTQPQVVQRLLVALGLAAQPPVAMKLTGHRTRSVFQRYAIVEEGMLLEAGARLARAGQEPSGKVDAARGKVVELGR